MENLNNLPVQNFVQPAKKSNGIYIWVAVTVLAVISVVAAMAVFLLYFEPGQIILNRFYPNPGLILKISQNNTKAYDNFGVKINFKFEDDKKAEAQGGFYRAGKGDVVFIFPESYSNSPVLGHSNQKIDVIYGDKILGRDPYDGTYHETKDGSEDKDVINLTKYLSPKNILGWALSQKQNATMEKGNFTVRMPLSAEAFKNGGEIILSISPDTYFVDSANIYFKNSENKITEADINFSDYGNIIKKEIPEITENAFGDYIARESVYIRTQADGDRDYLFPLWEEKYFQCRNCVNKFWDDDNDGLINIQEFLFGSNPLEKDTNKNGIGDYEELLGGKSPGNANIIPSLYMPSVNLLSEHVSGPLKAAPTPPKYGGVAFRHPDLSSPLVTIPEDAKSLSFSYIFVGKEDFAGVFLGDILLAKIDPIPGDIINEEDLSKSTIRTAFVDLSKVLGKSGRIEFVLNSVGKPGGDFIVNLKSIKFVY